MVCFQLSNLPQKIVNVTLQNQEVTICRKVKLIRGVSVRFRRGTLCSNASCIASLTADATLPASEVPALLADPGSDE